MIRVVIFDLDDTLFLERDYVMSGYHAVATHLATTARLEHDLLFDSLKAGYYQGRRDRNFEALLAQFHISARVDDLIAVYRNHTPNIAVPLDSSEALKLAHQRFRLGMITDGRPATQHMKLRALGISHYFTKIIVNDLILGRSKYEPDSFCRMLAYFSVDASETVYVGDNLTKDFIWPQRLGMKSVCVQRPGSLYHDSVPSMGDIAGIPRIPSLHGLLSSLDAL